MFLDAGDCKELRDVLAKAFGDKLLEQDAADLRDDLAYIFGRLDLEAAGEVSLPQFVNGIPRIMREIKPLAPDSPRVPLEVRLRWGRLVQTIRHRRANVALHAPIAALKRISQQVQAAQASGGYLAARMALARVLGEQASQFENCDWTALPDSELVQATAQVATLANLISGLDRESVLQPTMATLKAIAVERLDRLEVADLITVTLALLPARAPSRCEAGAEHGIQAAEALQQRSVVRRVSAKVGAMGLPNLAKLAQHMAAHGDCDPVFADAAVRRIVSLVQNSHGKVLSACKTKDLANLLWLMAQHGLVGATGMGAFEIQQVSRAIAETAAGRGQGFAKASDSDLARVCWATGYLGLVGGALCVELGAEAAKRATTLGAAHLAQVAWALSSLGERPEGMVALAEAAARPDLELQALTASELARLAAALGSWAFRGYGEKLAELWRWLRRRCNDFVGEEVVMTASASVRLGIRDDNLFRSLFERSLRIGPAKSTGQLLAWFEAYARLWPTDANRQLVTSLALAAARRGGVAEAAARMGPPARHDPRMERLAEARDGAFVAGVLS